MAYFGGPGKSKNFNTNAHIEINVNYKADIDINILMEPDAPPAGAAILHIVDTLAEYTGLHTYDYDINPHVEA